MYPMASNKTDAVSVCEKKWKRKEQNLDKAHKKNSILSSLLVKEQNNENPT